MSVTHVAGRPVIETGAFLVPVGQTTAVLSAGADTISFALNRPVAAPVIRQTGPGTADVDIPHIPPGTGAMWSGTTPTAEIFVYFSAFGGAGPNQVVYTATYTVVRK